MTIGAMIGDILKSLFKKPATEQYPFVKTAAPAQFRGKLTYDASKCTGCMMCMRDCPADAIEIITIDKVNKRFVMRYDMARCTYCAQCVVNCKFKCLDMSDEMWELASTEKKPFEVFYGREEDVAPLLEKRSQECPEPPAKPA